MLSRTADHLFWMARYTERAENTARMLDANYQLSLLPQSDEYAGTGLARDAVDLRTERRLCRRASGHEKPRRDRFHGARFVESLVDHELPAGGTRERARRARLDQQRTVGEPEHDMARRAAPARRRHLDRDPYEFLEWVKFRSHLSRGVQLGTLVKDDAFWFMRLGTFIERADNTARILDVKFEMLEQRRGHSAQPFNSLPLDGGAALGVGFRGVPQGLSRCHHAGACTRVS